MSLVVETIRTLEGMEALRDSWEELLAADPERSPFLAYDWFRCCLEDAEGAELFLLAVRAEGPVVGIAPLARSIAPGRFGSTRTVGFLRCRETPFADFVVAPGRREAVIDAIWRHLLEDERGSWDQLSLWPWAEASANYGAARARLSGLGVRWTERTASLVPVVPTVSEWDTFWEGRSYLFRKSRRGILNRMAKLGAVEVQAFRADDRGQALQAFFHVADRAWKQEEGLAVTSREGSRRFFTALTEAAERRGWLLLWVLRLNGTPVAIEYNLTEGGVVYALRADFDKAYRQHSPGAYLEYQIIRRLFSEGYRAYYTGPGFDAYKLRWTEDVRRCVAITVYNRGLRNGLQWLVEGWAIPRLKRLRRRVDDATRRGAGSA